MSKAPGRSPKPEFWGSVTAAQSVGAEIRGRQEWTEVEASYARWNLDSMATPRVPRMIHQIWLGSPLPDLYARWSDTWRRLNPGWEYRLWTEAEIGAFGLENDESYQKSPNFGVKSDLARYEILERLGGVYADTDFECLASFESLASSTAFFAGLMYGEDAPINNGLIGSIPGHPILRSMIQALSEPFVGHDGMEILAYSGPIRFAKVVREYLVNGAKDAVVLPTSILYPFPNTSLQSKDIDAARRWARPESLAIHYWEVSWKKDPLSTRAYWWMKRHFPAPVVRLVYRLLKGRAPSE